MKMDDEIPEPRRISNEHPRVMQTLMKMAVETLSSRHKEIWFLHNNARLTQDEIAAKLSLSRDNVKDYIKRIETKLIKYCERNKGAYLLLKLEHKIMNEETE